MMEAEGMRMESTLAYAGAASLRCGSSAPGRQIAGFRRTIGHAVLYGALAMPKAARTQKPAGIDFLTDHE